MKLWFPWEITILKAIHNWDRKSKKKHWAVISMGNYHFESNSQHGTLLNVYLDSCDFHGKLPFWKQFTTKLTELNNYIGCDFHGKLLFWKQFTTCWGHYQKPQRLWFPWEITILKAIHNPDFGFVVAFVAVISMGNYHFESNSQPPRSIICFILSCDFHGKLPFWKQFTTLNNANRWNNQLWFPWEITILKAIHNG